MTLQYRPNQIARKRWLVALLPRPIYRVIASKRPSRNQAIGISVGVVVIFIFFAPVIVAAQIQQARVVVTPTCVQQPCRLAQPGNSSSGYIDITNRVNATVYVSIGFRFLCLGVQISIPLGAGSVGCYPSSSPQPNMAQVAVTVVNLRSGDFQSTNSGTTFTCGSAAASYITIANSGTGGTSVVSAAINWGGQTNSFSLAAGSTCTIGASYSASPTQNILFASAKLPTSATAGGSFTGTVTLSNGAVLLFAGTFQ